MTLTTEPEATTPAVPLTTEAKREPAPPRRQRPNLWGPAFAAPHAIGLGLFTLTPIVIALVMSFHDWPMIGSPTFTGMDNFQRLFADETFRAAFGNTLLFVVLYLPLNLIVSMGMAAWLSPRIKGRQFFRVLFFLPTVTPIVANAVVWRLIYEPGGTLDATSQTLFGIELPNFLADPNWAMAAIVVMSVWQGFGYNMLVFSAALDSVPENQIEAAQLDGANPWTIFWRIQLPLISPSVFFATIMTLITSFQVFIQPYILTKGGPGTSTLTLVQFIYNQGFTFQQLGLAAAAGWVLFIMILVITAVQFIGQKKWVHYE
ncbi:ABC transporter substrate-binding protein [Pseudoclavibacter sp. RFBG4]|uniref:carbohydrate ABC transporter permease n=1 Tax=unclassified Pseudoclavibacter TaxID=2615177 RepID=UPI000CE761CA|nr:MULTISPECIES: sugar ABC transporter permease [unclassified Pseudoclavibacter]PPF37095.1 ABC transporter substrate-binding protein [Pseudoclavibacter sp. AY1H1]PPF78516.1 ABC transporter substrate-binding protein [Pseudoclavibacter sp. Z016]PPG01844.1 ABC transporter substrate-binding protein [Pseudoclavibacter sp. RFBI5]PPG26791.1 ABC transporter substrate-binding protein [Pseudoclavibacter sp. RFBG4]